MRRSSRIVLATTCACATSALLGPPAHSARIHPTHPWPNPAPARMHPYGAAAPILMYHVIAPPPASSLFPGLYVPPQQFKAQMLALKRSGYDAVTLSELRAAWQGGAALPPHPIVISFDNGYRTQYTQAYPILRRLGWVGDENLQLTGLPPKQGGLTRRELERLVRAGWELDTQGVSHADLNLLGPRELRYQVAFARAVLRRRFHVPVDWFCYPSGHYTPRVVAAVKRAGYVGATTVVPGWASRREDAYRLPRLRVLGGTSATQLLVLIADARHDAAAPATYPTQS